MIADRNEMYYVVSCAKKISLRAHVRALSEEIKKRKSYKGRERSRRAVSVQLVELKQEVRYINLFRAYLRGKPYRSVERTTTKHNRVCASELLRLVKHHLPTWQGMHHTEEMVGTWLSA